VLQVDKDAENGRGLHVVSQLATRWGARRTYSGKVVWCEQTVPESVMEALRAVAAESAISVAAPDAVTVAEPVVAAVPRLRWRAGRRHRPFGIMGKP